MADRLGFGILGTGMIARKFAAQLPQSQRAELVAVGSRTAGSADGFAVEHPCRAHASYERLLDDPDVEAVYVSLPNGLHHEWTLRCLEAGKHVLCEKPIGSSRAEAEAMFDAASRADHALVEAFMYRTHPAVERFIATARSGRIGQLKLIRTHFTFNRAADPDNVRYQRQQAGGSLMDVGCYCVNFARAIAGREPTSVHAIAHRHGYGVDDYAAGTLQFGAELLCVFTCGMTVEGDRTTFVCGSEGHMAIDTPWFSDGRFRVTVGDQTEDVAVPEARPLYAVEADAFAAVVRDGAPPWLSREDSLGNMDVLDRLRTVIGLI